MQQADIGLVGLAVMGENLALNLESRGFTVAVHNRTPERVTAFMEGRGRGKQFIAALTPEALAAALKRPRKLMMMVKAGEAVDELIASLVPHLAPGDILLDGGNSHFADSERRWRELKEKGIHFVGTGVSGGELGALHGPSIMPGGAAEAWPEVGPLLQAIAAQVDGEPCCTWIGDGGAGHFVKMVHNGIEYGDMQLISEAYQLLHEYAGLDHKEMQAVFAEWNEGELGSYLIEITRDILGYRDEDGTPLVEKILDTSGQKGTGKWTGLTACDLGVPLTLIGEAVFARFLSAAKEERVRASGLLAGPATLRLQGDRKAFVNALKDALYAAKIISYAQGYTLLREAAREYGWRLDYGAIAALWRGGCIIRSVFLNRIKEAYEATPELENLMLAPFFREKLAAAQNGWREVVAAAARAGIPVPAMGAALSYYDGYRAARLPANLLQAQRDYFGAHTYERTDRPRGEFFHTNWTGQGGETVSTTYTR